MDTGFDIPFLLDFLRDLSQHNDREWFTAHKEEYNRATEIRNNLAEALIRAVADVDPEAANLSVKDCTYRIYRDVRFSSDKRPYKTHCGIFINPPYGKKSLLCGYYFHLEPGTSFVCAGTIGWPGNILAAVRRAVYDNIDEYISIVQSEEFRQCYPSLGADPVKTTPKGFPRTWPYLDYIRPRHFLAESVHDDAIYTAPGLIHRLEPYIREAKRFNDFINFTVEDFL